MIHATLTVKGKVQGVAFRAHIKTAAQNYRLCGYVKNLIGGDVLIEVEGERQNIELLVDWCHIGSPRSKVESVEVEYGIIKNYDHFQIKN